MRHGKCRAAMSAVALEVSSTKAKRSCLHQKDSTLGFEIRSIGFKMVERGYVLNADTCFTVRL